MPSPELFVDRRGTAGNTNLVIPIPAHPNGSKAVVGVVVEGDATPITGAPGWTVDVGTYFAVADQTYVGLSHQALTEAETVVQVSWTGTRPAAGVVVVSPDAPTLVVGTPTTVHGDTGVAGGVVAVEGDIPVILGGTDDGAPTRYPNGVTSLTGVSDTVWLDDQQTGVDVWAVLGAKPLAAGPTGNVTYELGGTGIEPDGQTPPFLASSTTAIAPWNVAVESLDLNFAPITPEIGEVVLIAGVGQAPAADLSRPFGTYVGDNPATVAPATTLTFDLSGQAFLRDHLCMIHVKTSGAAGGVTADSGFEIVDVTPGAGFIAIKRLDTTETDVTFTVTNPVHMRGRVRISNAQSDGTATVTTATTTTAAYGPHPAGQVSTDPQTNVYLFWSTDVDNAAVTGVTANDAGTWVLNATEARPAGHTGEYGTAGRFATAAGLNPEGTVTVSAAATTTVTTIIANPKPMYPTDLRTPISTGSGVPWNTYIDIPGNGETPSQYLWWKVVDQGDLDDGSITVYPNGDLGEFSVELFRWPSADPGGPFDGTPVTNGTAFSETITSPAVTTTADDGHEIVAVYATDYQATPRQITSVAVTGADFGTGAAMFPSGQVVSFQVFSRPTAGAGTARTGAIANTAGAGSSTRHIAQAFGLKAAPNLGSWQVSQLVVFGEVPNPGPTTVVQTPLPAIGCVADPVTITGRSTGEANVVNVDLEIRREADNNYWNGTAWQAAVTTVPAELPQANELVNHDFAVDVDANGIGDNWQYTASTPAVTTFAIDAADFVEPGTSSQTLTNTSSNNPRIFQAASLTVGAAYTFTGWVKADPGMSVRVRAGFSFAGGTEYGAQTMVADNTWQPFSLAFAPTDPGLTFFTFLLAGTTAGTFKINNPVVRLASHEPTDLTWTYDAAGAFTEPGSYEVTSSGTDDGLTETGAAELRGSYVTPSQKKSHTIGIDDFDAAPQEGDLIRWVLTGPGPTEFPTFNFTHPGTTALDYTPATGYRPRVRVVEQTHTIGTTSWTFTGSNNIRVAGLIFDGSVTAATTYSTPVDGTTPVDPAGQANLADGIGVTVTSVNYTRGQISGPPAGHTTLFNTLPSGGPRQLYAATTDLATAGTYDPPASPYSDTNESATAFTIVANPLGTATRNIPPATYTAPPRTYCVEGPTAIGRIREAKLGDGNRVWVEVVGRHGGVAPGTVITRLPVQTSDGWFERVLDDTSDAEVHATYSTLDLRHCHNVLPTIETYAHELRIWWDGLIAWQGPITWLEHLSDGVVLKAEDRSTHLNTRTLTGHDHSATRLSDIFAAYLRDAYLQDPWGMTFIVQPVGVTGTRTVLPEDGRVAATAVDELARTGIDWTVVGTKLLIGGAEVPTRNLTTLNDSHFTTPLRVIEDGTRRATNFVMSGSQVAGEVGLRADDPRRRRYGLITGRAHDSQIEDQASVNQAARTRLDFGQDPLFIDPGVAVLTPSAPVAMVDLEPGARTQLVAAATHRTVTGAFRLERVRANLDGTVSVTFQPLGTTTGGT